MALWLKNLMIKDMIKTNCSEKEENLLSQKIF